MNLADFYEQRGSLTMKARQAVPVNRPPDRPHLTDEQRACWSSALEEGRVTRWTLEAMARAVDSANSSWWTGTGKPRYA